MRQDLFILGSSGLAREMAALVDAVNRIERKWTFRGFIGESKEEVGRLLSAGEIVGNDEWLLDGSADSAVVLGIGHPKIRKKVLQRYLQAGERFQYPNLIHPQAVVDSKSIILGRGNAITAGCVLTCDIVLGNFNILNLNTTVGHDAQIGDYNVLNPGTNVSGGVVIGTCVLIGTGTQILENRVIGDHATVGAGAVVTKDVEPGQTVVGIPAKPLSK